MITVLIAEDDASVRDMLRKYLEMQSYTVITAADGELALELAKKMLPDIIISDVMMPKMNGYNLKSELGKDPVYSTIPFIFLTSMSDYENIRTGMQLGADDYIAKPLRLDDVASSIEVQLKKRTLMLKNLAKQKSEAPKKEYSTQEHILIKDKGVPRFLKISNIICITADEKYSKIYLSTGEKTIISLALKDWEDMLPASSFVRIHRSTIINISYIEKVDKWFQRGYRVRLKGVAEPFEISRRYYSKMSEHFV